MEGVAKVPCGAVDGWWGVVGARSAFSLARDVAHGSAEMVDDDCARWSVWRASVRPC